MDPRWLLICEGGRALSLTDDGKAIRCNDDAACGLCPYYVYAESCEGIAYDPPASEICPALPRIYVCANIVPPSVNGANVVIKYNGTCYVIGTGVESVPDGAVTLTDPAQFENIGDCRDPRCNSNRFFYRARTCSGEPDTVPDVYVCVAGVPFDCAVFRYNATPSDPATYCYRLDRSTPIDEDDIPAGSVRVGFVSPTQTFERCCECLDGCQTETINSAPCAGPDQTSTCCCNLTSERTFTYTRSEVRTEGRDGFPPFWSKDTYATTVPAVVTCYGDGTKTVTPGSMTHRFQYPNGGTDETTVEPIEVDVSCLACHPPAFSFVAPDGSGNCSGVFTVGDAQREWNYDIANRCTSSFSRKYEKLTDTDTPADYVESLIIERWTLVVTGNERCTGGCDGYAGPDLSTLSARVLARKLRRAR